MYSGFRPAKLCSNGTSCSEVWRKRAWRLSPILLCFPLGFVAESFGNLSQKPCFSPEFGNLPATSPEEITLFSSRYKIGVWSRAQITDDGCLVEKEEFQANVLVLCAAPLATRRSVESLKFLYLYVHENPLPHRSDLSPRRH